MKAIICIIGIVLLLSSKFVLALPTTGVLQILPKLSDIVFSDVIGETSTESESNLVDDASVVSNVTEEVSVVPEVIEDTPIVSNIAEDIPIVVEVIEVVEDVLATPEIVEDTSTVFDTVEDIPIVSEVVEDVLITPEVVEDIPIVSEVVEDTPVVSDVVAILDVAPEFTSVTPSQTDSIVLNQGDSLTFEVIVRDLNGDLTRGVWKYNSTSEEVTLSGEQQTVTKSIQFDEVKTYTVTFTAYDSEGQEATVAWTVNVNAIPQAPSMKVEKPVNFNINVTQGDTLDFEVTVSDTNGDLARGVWEYNNSTEEVSLAGELQTVSKSIRFDAVKTYIVKFTAYDATDLDVSATWTVNVTALPLAPTIKVEKPDSSNIDVTQGDTIFEVIASDADGDLAKGVWEYNDMSEEMDLSGGQQIMSKSIQFAEAKTYTVKFTVYDSTGLEASETWTVNVTALPHTPVINVTEPSSTHLNMTQGDSRFEVMVSDVDGDLVKGMWQYHNISEEVSLSGEQQTVSKSIQFDEAKTYTVTFTAYDATGLEATESWTVNVATLPQAPTIKVEKPMDSTISAMQGDSTDFAVTVSDVDGDLTQGVWEYNGMLEEVSLSGEQQTVSTAIQFDTAETYTVKFTVYDANGLEATETWNVEVSMCSKNNITACPADKCEEFGGILVGTINKAIYQQTRCVSAPLAEAIGFDRSGQFVLTDTLFSNGFVTSSANSYVQTGQIQYGSFVSVVGQIEVDPRHIGQEAEIVVFAGNRAPQVTKDDATIWYMLLDSRRGDGNANFDFWTQKKFDSNDNDADFSGEELANLTTFIHVDALKANHSVPFWSGGVVDGTLKIYLGYRLMQGDDAGSIFINANPILMTIDNSANPFNGNFKAPAFGFH